MISPSSSLRYRQLFWLLFSVLLPLGACAPLQEEAAIQNGVLDLRRASPYEKAISLSGTWRFYPRESVASMDASRPGRLLAAPGRWTPVLPEARSFGVYRLVVLLPAETSSRSDRDLALRFGWIASAARIYANGKLVYSAGTPAASRDHYIPWKGSGVALLGDPGQQLDLRIEAANFDDRDAGIMQAMHLGGAQRILAERERAIFIEAFVSGSILLIGLYHLGLFFNRREDRAALWFGICCAIISLRLLLTGEYFLPRILSLPYLWQVRSEILSFYLALPVFVAYLAASFPLKLHRGALWIAGVATFLASAATIILPMPDLTRVLTPFLAVTVAAVAYCIGVWTHAAIKGRSGGLTALLGGLVFGATVVHDSLNTEGLIQSVWIAPYGLVVFILSQSYILARFFAETYQKVISLADALRSTRDSYARFVPVEFLKQLGTTEITAVSLGQQVQSEMTVMFTDIRGFTSLSEQMSPRDNFNFLNSYLSRMTPVVESHEGIVDKYIGDAIMALFPGGAEAALNAAIEMQRVLRAYNHERQRAGYDPLRISTGLHHGPLMLGTVGAANRMQGTVISDTVNLAARMESLTRAYDAHILISQAVYARLHSPEKYSLRLVDHVRVKGKRESVAVYEVFDGLPEYRVEFFRQTRGEFERGLFNYQNGEAAEAEACMRRVLEINADDEVARIYLSRIANEEAAELVHDAPQRLSGKSGRPQSDRSGAPGDGRQGW